MALLLGALPVELIATWACVGMAVTKSIATAKNNLHVFFILLFLNFIKKCITTKSNS
jgi:hypothetical protein